MVIFNWSSGELMHEEELTLLPVGKPVVRLPTDRFWIWTRPAQLFCPIGTIPCAIFIKSIISADIRSGAYRSDRKWRIYDQKFLTPNARRAVSPP